MEPAHPHNICSFCGILNCQRTCFKNLNHPPAVPMIDRREYEKSLTYPPGQEYIGVEFRQKHQKALEEWHYVSSWKGPQAKNEFALLSSSEANMNAAHPAASQAPTTGHRIHFGFDNMWYQREPVFLVNSEGEAKIWWQQKGVRPNSVVAPELCTFLADAISPALFLERLVAAFGMPPAESPLAVQEREDMVPLWCAMMTRKNGDVVAFRVYNKRPQIAYNGTLLGMYDSLDLVQLLLGPPGKNLYMDKTRPFTPAPFIGSNPGFYGPEPPPGSVTCKQHLNTNCSNDHCRQSK